jgi:hypothetical protein
MSAQMGWNPLAPTNPLRVLLIAYLRAQRLVLERGGHAGEPVVAAEMHALDVWIAWLRGEEVSDQDLARAVAAVEATP